MSLLSPSQVRAVLTPGSVTLLRQRGRYRKVVEDSAQFTVDAREDTRPWENALDTLKIALAQFARKGESLTVVLSNHFCHFVVLPALPSLASEEEDAAFARHSFREVYGDAVLGWSIKVSGESPVRPRLASAIEEPLLGALRHLAREAGLGLQSVQPFLMTAYNAWAAELNRKPVWFALYEPGRLCICLCTREGIRSVRGSPAGDAWRTELPLLLEREVRLQEMDGLEVPKDAYVFHPSQASAASARSMPANLSPLLLREVALPPTAATRDIALALVGL